MAKQHRALRTRHELLRSAAEVFGNVGYADAAIAAVSSRAGVSNGALHFHFRSKRALGEAVERASMQTLLGIIGRVPLRHPAPLQLLVDTSQALAESLLSDPVLRGGFSLGNDATWQGEVNLWEQWQDWVQLMLIVARDRELLAEGVVIEEAVFAITSVVAGFEVLSRKGAEWGSRQALVGFWRLMLPQLAVEGGAQALNPEGAALPDRSTREAEGWGAEDICGVA